MTDADAVRARDDDPLLSVRNLEKHFPVREGWLDRETGRVRAVDGVDFDLHAGEALGLVGESGCGKSTVARTVVGLTDPTGGEVRFDGQDVTDLSGREEKRFHRRVQLVFQDPTTAFDPRMTVGEAVAEPMTAHGLTDAARLRERVDSLLSVVGLATDLREKYPHELSGGQQQRAALARALSLNPDVLVLDEPVSALDVSVQAEILRLVTDLRDAFDLAIVCISHDMSVVRQLCDRVAVMYVGELVERGPTEALFADPKHPYTEALLSAIPQPDPTVKLDDAGLAGDVPDPADPPAGCRFHTRCPAVVPPDDVALSPETFRAGHTLLVDLRAGNVDRVAGDPSGRADGGTEVGADSPADAPTARLRAAYDLPSPLADESAETALSTALDAAVAGEHESAVDRLEPVFGSPCDREPPAQRRVDGRLVACHHYREEEEP